MGECVRGVGVSRDGCVSRVGYSVRGWVQCQGEGTVSGGRVIPLMVLLVFHVVPPP